MLKYKPEDLRKALTGINTSQLIPILQENEVNPNTITEVAVIDSLSVLVISEQYYVTVALSSGHEGAGPKAFKEFMEWCGCGNQKIYELINRQPRVHFLRDENNKWAIYEPNVYAGE